jgi:TRAP-type C4-dicarboxylate transport system permease small subunit
MKILEKIENFVVLNFLGIMFVVLFFQIIMRYLFNTPLIWSEELARYLFVWVAFIGASFGVRDSAHIKLTVIFNYFPRKFQKIFTIVTNIITIIFFLYLIPESISLTIEQFAIDSSAMGIPMGIVFLAVPVGFIMMSFRLLLNTLVLMNIISD